MATTTNNNRARNRRDVEERLKKIYYDPHHPASLGSVRALAKAAKVKIPQARLWLKSQAAYTLHRAARKRYPTRQYVVHDIDEQ